MLYERLGSKLPSPPGRPSATERYPTREDYAAAVRTAAEMLVAERFLLPEYVDAIVDKAIADYCRPTPLAWSRRTADRNLPRVHRRSEEPDDSGQPYFHVKDVVPIVVGVNENDCGKT